MLRCIFKHDWDLIGSDRTFRWSGAGYISINFLRCKKCGKRKAGVESSDRLHSGVRAYAEAWEKAGHLPGGKPKSGNVLQLVKGNED